MIIDYELSPKYLPTARQVWLMSKEMEKDGLEVNTQILKAMERGEVKYYNHTLYKLCRGCMSFFTLDHFTPNKRYVLGVNYLCKDCVSRRKRIRKYGQVSYITEVGMEYPLSHVNINVTDETKNILIRRLNNEEESV